MAIELDELKGVWNEIESDSTNRSNSLYFELQTRWNQHKEKLRRKFIIEFLVYLVIYIGAILIITTTASGQQAELFGWKVVLLSLIFVAPVGVSLHQSISETRKVDFTTNLITYIDTSIEKLQTSKKLYVRYSYLFSGFTLVMLFTDSFFLSQSLLLKASVIVFIGVSTLVAKPYFNLIYGKDLKHLEQLKASMKQ